MTADNELRQQMLEMIHGLLDDTAQRALMARISSDPEAARAYAEVSIEADLLAKAARLEGPKIELPQRRVTRGAAARSGPAAYLPWIVYLAASVLVLVTGGGYVWDHFSQKDIARDHLRLLVSAPATLAPGVDGRVTVRTQSVTGEPLPAQVEVALVALNDKQERQLLPGSERIRNVGPDGQIDLTIPASLQLSGPVRLEVLAHNGGSHPRMVRRLDMEAEHYVAQLGLEKPWYQPGDTIYFRALALENFSLASRRELPVEFELLDPSDALVAGSKSQGVTQRGVGNGSFPLDANLAGGMYTLVARSLEKPAAFPETKRQFLVQKYRLPRLKKELELTRDSYTPGDPLIADFSAVRAEGGPAAGAQIHIVATVDGLTAFEKTDKLSSNGTYQVRLSLPKKIEKGEGQLAVIVDDGGTRETSAKTIPINLGKVAVEFYPEGGDLVAGLVNRVYFAARNPTDEPVHIEGHVLDAAGKEVAQVTTTKEGRGSFYFTPEKDQTYTLKITKPEKVQSAPKLPAVNPLALVTLSTRFGGKFIPIGDGNRDIEDPRLVGLKPNTGVLDANEPMSILVTSTRERMPLAITATCRGVEVGQTTHITGAAGEAQTISLPLSDAADGVIRVTVYDYSGEKPVPIAERLVYRRPARKLTVTLAEPDTRFSPGQKAEVRLKVVDERGRPVAAALGVAVVDDALLGLAREGTKHQPATMPTHFLLGTEIDKPEDLENVNFYLKDDAKSAVALDLLLGTQGWRRFADRRLDQLKGQDGIEAKNSREALDRLVAMSGQAGPPAVYDNLNDIQPAYERQMADYDSARSARLAMFGRIGLIGGGVLLLAIAVMGLLQLARQPRLWIPALAAATGCLVVGGLWVGMSPRPHAPADAAASFRADDVRQLAKNGGPVEDARGQAELEKLEVNEEAGDMAMMADAAIAPQPMMLRGAVPQNAPAGAPQPVAAMAAPAMKAAPVAEALAAKPGDNRRNGFQEQKRAQQFGVRERLARDADAKQDARFDKQIAGGRALAEMQAPAAPAPVLAQGKMAAGAIMAGDVAQGQQLRAPRMKLQAGGWARTNGINGINYLRRQMRQAAVQGNDAQVVELAKQLEKQLEAQRFPVRQYAHQHTPSEAGVRTDFAETLYWNPLVIANEQGEATIRFDLSDAVTTFRVAVDAHAAAGSEGLGRIGTGGGGLVARIPFSIEPKLPLEVNAGDTIDLPVAIINDTKDGMTVGLKLEYDNLLSLTGDAARKLDLAAAARQREFFSLAVTGEKGKAKLRLAGTAGTLSDTVEKTIEVVPPGFPVSESYAGKLEGEREQTVALPKEWVKGSLSVSLECYPTTLADLEKGMESIFQEPSGCFEQASMSNYPNVLMMQYMQEHNVADPAVTRRARDLMKSGYGKLSAFECKQKGYEWFGGDPGHEALTAYGLMEFRDMAAVYEVDPTMLKRTSEWLLARRDGKGEFQRNPRALDSFGSAPPEVTNAYIVWALTESGQKGIDGELEHAVDLGRKSDDPYVIALSAASAVNYGQKEAGRELLKKLVGKQQADGHLEGTQGSITRSGGESLKVETTSIAALAWLKLPEFLPQANKSIDWILKSRQGAGGFGSTQATILALKALVEHAKASRATVSGGELIVLRDGQEIGRTKFEAGQHDAIAVTGLVEKLQPGENKLTLKLSGDNKMPFALAVNYRAATPVSQAGCPVKLATKLGHDKVAAGGTVGLIATLDNTTDKGQPMTIAILGIPGGTRPRTDQLEELKKHGTIDFYETRAREVICYWRSLAPNRHIEVRLDLVADVPGGKE
ncbi:MAG: hypothetical protein K8T25_03865 [Planctomycetia bacterium]|nr:hypothetical protein [Planctomycetia bacterium]